MNNDNMSNEIDDDNSREELLQILREWGVPLNTVVDELDEGWDENDVPPTFAAHFYPIDSASDHQIEVIDLTNEERIWLESVGSCVASATDPSCFDMAVQLPKTLENRFLNLRESFDVSIGMSGAVGHNDEVRWRSSGKIVYVNSDENVVIDCPIEKLPTGLCWLLLEDPFGAIKMVLPSFEVIGENWYYMSSLRSIFGDHAKDLSDVVPGVFPATEKSRSSFSDSKVRSLAEQFPCALQRERALEFLNATGRSEST